MVEFALFAAFVAACWILWDRFGGGAADRRRTQEPMETSVGPTRMSATEVDRARKAAAEVLSSLGATFVREFDDEDATSFDEWRLDTGAHPITITVGLVYAAQGLSARLRHEPPEPAAVRDTQIFDLQLLGPSRQHWVGIDQIATQSRRLGAWLEQRCADADARRIVRSIQVVVRTNGGFELRLTSPHRIDELA
ncbi:MAG: hypothetical protein JWM86_1734, partial [Thermoleophilia bacterium]|nr:hypothetical protein [Thermoleophilia bacterium]